MSHPLKKYARHVQHELEKREDLKRPAYSWCLSQVVAIYAEAKVAAREPEGDSTYAERLDRILVEKIGPNAKRANPQSR